MGTVRYIELNNKLKSKNGQQELAKKPQIAAFLSFIFKYYLAFFLLNAKPINAEANTNKVVGSGTGVGGLALILNL